MAEEQAALALRVGRDREWDTSLRFVAHRVGCIVNHLHDWEFWMSAKALGAEVGLSAGHVRNQLRALVDEGVLEVVETGGHGPGSATRYRWILGNPGCGQPAVPSARGDGPSARGAALSARGARDTSSHKGHEDMSGSARERALRSRRPEEKSGQHPEPFEGYERHEPSDEERAAAADARAEAREKLKGARRAAS